jgi:hypothetical protein
VISHTSSGDMGTTNASPTKMTTRSRTVQPRLKERAERFLAKADASQTSSSQLPELSRSRKRKLQDVGGPETPALSDTGEVQEADPKETLRSAKSTKKSMNKSPKSKWPEAAGKNKPASSEFVRASELEPERSLSTPESTKKPRKLKSSEKSDEKRLKRYRKQAPQSFLQKLHRSQTQR